MESQRLYQLTAHELALVEEIKLTQARIREICANEAAAARLPPSDNDILIPPAAARLAFAVQSHGRPPSQERQHTPAWMHSTQLGHQLALTPRWARQESKFAHTRRLPQRVHPPVLPSLEADEQDQRPESVPPIPTLPPLRFDEQPAVNNGLLFVPATQRTLSSRPASAGPLGRHTSHSLTAHNQQESSSSDESDVESPTAFKRPSTSPPPKSLRVSKYVRQSYMLDDQGTVVPCEEAFYALEDPALDEQPGQRGSTPRHKYHLPLPARDKEGKVDVMPLLRFSRDMRPERFPEPIRDRNKFWRRNKYQSLYSPRDPQYAASLETAKAKPTSDDPDAVISGTPTRRRDSLTVEIRGGVTAKRLKMWQRVTCIGNEQVIASVFGVGIVGRVFSADPDAERFMCIEIYRPKSCMCHALKVMMPDLEWLLRQSGLDSLLQSGRKAELCQAVVRMLHIDGDGDLVLHDEQSRDQVRTYSPRLRQNPALWQPAELDARFTGKSLTSSVGADAPAPMPPHQAVTETLSDGILHLTPHIKASALQERLIAFNEHTRRLHLAEAISTVALDAAAGLSPSMPDAERIQDILQRRNALAATYGHHCDDPLTLAEGQTLFYYITREMQAARRICLSLKLAPALAGVTSRRLPIAPLPTTGIRPFDPDLQVLARKARNLAGHLVLLSVCQDLNRKHTFLVSAYHAGTSCTFQLPVSLLVVQALMTRKLLSAESSADASGPGADAPGVCLPTRSIAVVSNHVSGVIDRRSFQIAAAVLAEAEAKYGAVVDWGPADLWSNEMRLAAAKWLLYAVSMVHTAHSSALRLWRRQGIAGPALQAFEEADRVARREAAAHTITQQTSAQAILDGCMRESMYSEITDNSVGAGPVLRHIAWLDNGSRRHLLRRRWLCTAQCMQKQPVLATGAIRIGGEWWRYEACLVLHDADKTLKTANDPAAWQTLLSSVTECLFKGSILTDPSNPEDAALKNRRSSVPSVDLGLSDSEDDDDEADGDGDDDDEDNSGSDFGVSDDEDDEPAAAKQASTPSPVPTPATGKPILGFADSDDSDDEPAPPPARPAAAVAASQPAPPVPTVVTETTPLAAAAAITSALPLASPTRPTPAVVVTQDPDSVIKLTNLFKPCGEQDAIVLTLHHVASGTRHCLAVRRCDALFLIATAKCVCNSSEALAALDKSTASLESIEDVEDPHWPTAGRTYQEAVIRRLLQERIVISPQFSAGVLSKSVQGSPLRLALSSVIYRGAHDIMAVRTVRDASIIIIGRPVTGPEGNLKTLVEVHWCNGYWWFDVLELASNTKYQLWLPHELMESTAHAVICEMEGRSVEPSGKAIPPTALERQTACHAPVHALNLHAVKCQNTFVAFIELMSFNTDQHEGITRLQINLA